MDVMPGVLDWLLEPGNPSARYLALTGLLGQPEHDPEVVAARAAIPGWGPARAILEAQWPEGYWMHPGVGYSPKHKATVWQIIFWAALGGPPVPAIERACAYVLDNARLPNGLFTADKTPKGAIACLNGNLLRAMLQLDHRDPRVDESVEALAREVVQDEFRCRCNRRPRPARMRDGLPCAWGTTKAVAALAEVPAERRSPAVRAAIDAGTAFLLSGDPAAGSYPAAVQPSPLWRQLGFPLSYAADLLEVLDVLLRLGHRGHPALEPAVAAVRDKAGQDGRWVLEHTPGNTWGSFGRPGRPNKWVTLRALRALKAWEPPLEIREEPK